MATAQNTLSFFLQRGKPTPKKNEGVFSPTFYLPRNIVNTQSEHSEILRQDYVYDFVNNKSIFPLLISLILSYFTRHKIDRNTIKIFK
jgi:hypothetical protein